MIYLKEGALLDGGKYRIIRVLGQGGFGITYLAENVLLEIKVAIKEFFPKEFCDREATSHVTIGTSNNRETVEKLKKRFVKEAKNLASLNYEGIVGIRDVFEENSTAYYVMDFIQGKTLAEIVKSQGALDEQTAVRYIKKVGASLEYIHYRNMTHFDVKPSNIIINSKTDQPVLIDFGLSKQYDLEGQATSSMLQGVSQGFSPIELYNPGTVETFSPRTDVYSLAATLYYLLTARIPPVASQLVEEGLKVPSFVSPPVRDAIVKAMSTSRNHRHESVREFCDSLSATGPSATAANEQTRLRSDFKQVEAVREESPYIPPVKGKKSGRPWVVVAIIALCLVICGGLVWAYMEFFDGSGSRRVRSSGRDLAEERSSEDENTYDTTDYFPVVNEMQTDTSMMGYVGRNEDDAQATQEAEDPVEEYTEYQPSSNNWYENEILSSIPQTVNGSTYYFYDGNFTVDGTAYPVRIAFKKNADGTITDAQYKNMTFGGVVKMKVNFYNDGMQLTGLVGGKDFVISIDNQVGNTFYGYAYDDQMKVSTSVDIYPTYETFSLK